MGLLRVLIFALAAWLVWRLIQTQLRKGSRQEPKRGDKLRNEKMVKCMVCGTHLPEHSAINTDNRWFCSQQHLDRYREDAGDDNQEGR